MGVLNCTLEGPDPPAIPQLLRLEAGWCHVLQSTGGLPMLLALPSQWRKAWVKANCDTLILFIVFLAMIPLFCICGLMKQFCCKCRPPEQNLRSHHQTPPEAPTTAPLEIWVPTLDPPPPYDQVIMKPVEPPPPYSLRPEDTAG
ncbi:transmembrane protein 92-like isoform X2 [Cricetulus griseus]|uniref:Transmembrane protein 92-like isoform X2 n=1 Tax=Cricetulus griseus TaxID=10029 RepID=A0A9J7GD81_CRIGR|nr:transmembrane protein 92-like isoform X2 [Cricetulus griseus]